MEWPGGGGVWAIVPGNMAAVTGGEESWVIAPPTWSPEYPDIALCMEEPVGEEMDLIGG